MQRVSRPPAGGATAIEHQRLKIAAPILLIETLIESQILKY